MNNTQKQAQPLIPAWRIEAAKDAVAVWLAQHLPKRVAYWSFIQAGAGVMGYDEVVPEVAYIDVLKRIPRTSKDEWVKGYVIH